jgi:hypothetical protein
MDYRSSADLIIYTHRTLNNKQLEINILTGKTIGKKIQSGNIPGRFHMIFKQMYKGMVF